MCRQQGRRQCVSQKYMCLHHIFRALNELVQNTIHSLTCLTKSAPSKFGGRLAVQDNTELITSRMQCLKVVVDHITDILRLRQKIPFQYVSTVKILTNNGRKLNEKLWNTYLRSLWSSSSRWPWWALDISSRLAAVVWNDHSTRSYCLSLVSFRPLNHASHAHKTTLVTSSLVA